MRLSPGTRLGPYEIVAPLGAGGMGEVYRALDTRLNRAVALKIVNPAWADREEGRRRFEREARAVSRVNHPHVCALYDVGRADDREFLVMELVEGETLAARLARGPLSTAEVVRLGQAMASGLDAAHRQGVVHRDFKPGNVVLSKGGPKVLDFGLARALTDNPADDAETRAVSTSGAGTVLGTVPYMAPEQLQGMAVDARADVFALGAVLHEMATGRRAFDASSQAGVIAAVIERDPPPASSVRPGVPSLLDRLIAQCLSKDPDARPQTAGEVARALALIADGTAGQSPSMPAPKPSRERLVWIGVALVLAAVAGASLAWRPPAVPRSQPLITFAVTLPPGGRLPQVVDRATTLAVAPDGRHVVFPLTIGEVTRLWLHSFETMKARPLRGTEGAEGPFWSPGSRHIAFFASGSIQRVLIEGDVVEQICRTGTAFALGSWGAGDTIVFADSTGEALMRVPAAGGTPELVISTAGMGPTWPHMLPDGRQFLIGSLAGIHRGALDAGELTPLLDVPSAAMYAPSGHLVYVRESALVAQPYDLAGGRLTGEPRVLADGVQYFAATGGASLSVADTGAIVYRPSDIGPRRLVWIRRDSGEIADAAPEAPWAFHPRLSPDGRNVLIAQQIATSGSTDLWVYDLATGTPTRVTADRELDNWPAWWPDGRSLVFSRSVGGRVPHLVRQALTDVSIPTVLVPPGALQYDPDVAPDGRAVAFGMSGDIFLWRPDAAAPEPLVQTAFSEGGPAFSPDGRWLAYDSNISGRTEVYVRSFGRPGDPVRVSTAGGAAPRWRGDGREIFFLDLQGRIMSAAITVDNGSAARPPERLATGAGPISAFDVSRDGRRFVALMPRPDAEPSSLTVILNWERPSK